MLVVPLRPVLAILLVSIPLMDRVQFPHAIGYDFRAWYVIVAIMAAALLLKGRIRVPVLFLWIAAVVALHSCIVWALAGGISINSALQLMLVLGAATVLYSVISVVGPGAAVKAYVAGASAIAATILLEQFLNLLLPAIAQSVFGEAQPAAELSRLVRAHGLLYEPSQAAIYVTPALLVALYDGRRLLSLGLIAASLLTFSALAYIALVLVFTIFLVVSRNRLRLSKRASIALILAGMLVIAMAMVERRAGGQDESLANAVLSQGLIDEAPARGGTYATLALNSLVAGMALEDTQGLGVGFGDFREAFDRYSSFFVGELEDDVLYYNRKGGGSLAIRIVAELGWLGIALIVMALLRLVACVARARAVTITPGTSTADPRLFALAAGLLLVLLVVCLIRKDPYLNPPLLLAFAICAATPSLRPRRPSSRDSRLRTTMQSPLVSQSRQTT